MRKVAKGMVANTSETPEGCGVPVGSGKQDKKFIMRISMEDFSVINLPTISLLSRKFWLYSSAT